MLTAERLRSMNRKDLQHLAKKHGVKANDKSENIIQKLSTVFDNEPGEEGDTKGMREDDKSILKEGNEEIAEEKSTLSEKNTDEANEDVSKILGIKDLHGEVTINPSEAPANNEHALVKEEANEQQSNHHEPQKEHPETVNEKVIETTVDDSHQNEHIETNDPISSKEVFVSDANETHLNSTEKEKIEKKEEENGNIDNKKKDVENEYQNEENTKCEKEKNAIASKNEEVLSRETETTCAELNNVETPTNAMNKDEVSVPIANEQKEKEKQEMVASEACCNESSVGEVLLNVNEVRSVNSTDVPLQSDNQASKSTFEDTEAKTNNKNKIKGKTNVIRNGTSKVGDTSTKLGKDIKKVQPLSKPLSGTTKDRLAKQSTKPKIGSSLAVGSTSQRVEKSRSKTVDRPLTSEKSDTNVIPIADENKNGTNNREESHSKTMDGQKQSNQIVKKTKFDYSNVKPKVDTGLKKVTGKLLKNQTLDSSVVVDNNGTNKTKKPVKRSLSCIAPNERNSNKSHKRPRVMGVGVGVGQKMA